MFQCTCDGAVGADNAAGLRVTHTLGNSLLGTTRTQPSAKRFDEGIVTAKVRRNVELQRSGPPLPSVGRAMMITAGRVDSPDSFSPEPSSVAWAGRSLRPQPCDTVAARDHMTQSETPY